MVERRRLQQTATGTSYVEAHRQITAPAAATAEKVIVQPSRADWQRAKQCASGGTAGRARAADRAADQPRPQWSELDDLARAATGALQNRPPEQRGLWLSVWPRCSVTRRE
jgi:hypothetical protein